MPLAPNVPLSAHFQAGELNANDATASAGVVSNLYRTADGLERARALLGVPLVVTSGYRSPADNARVGGSPTSDHVNGLAADVKASGLTLGDAYRRLSPGVGGALGAFDQIIFYPTTGHIHFGFGYQMRQELRIALGESGYPLLTAQLVQQLPGIAGNLASVTAAKVATLPQSVALAVNANPVPAIVVGVALVAVVALLITL